MLKTPLRKVEKSLKMALYFISLNGMVYVIQTLFLYPVWLHRYFIELDVGLGILTLLFWWICLMSSPGFIRKPKDIEFLEIMKLIDPVQLCPDCEIVRTPRSRHCGTCNQCVERFDHHCPWINNCIGINNHKYFMIFVGTLVCNLFLNFSLTVLNLYLMISNDNYTL
jgi:hypothetical protein